MPRILYASLVVACIATSLPATAVGQSAPIDSLTRRIEVLERQNADLERRVHMLEARLNPQAPSVPAVQPSANAKDLRNWRRLRKGMSMDEVRALLGEPERVDAGPVTFWRWGSADVAFMNDGVVGWSEPGR